MNPVTRVPLLDLQRVPEADKAAFRAAFARVLDSGYFCLGPEVEAFERECASFLGAPFALGVSSGTDALLLAMMALGIAPGDEVIVPTYTFFATAGTVWRLGAVPVFTDIDPLSYNITAEAIAAKIGARTKAIIPVHLYGQCAEMEPILAVAAEHRLPVVEDAAQAIGSRCPLGAAAAMGTIGCVSFYPSKNLSGFGDGGLCTTADDGLRERMASLRVHGFGPKYYHRHVGGNFRMDAIQGALLRLRLPQLDDLAARRRSNAAFYTGALLAAGIGVVPKAGLDLGDRIGLPVECHGEHTYNQYVVRVPAAIGRDRLREALAGRNVGTEVYYPLCMHEQECFRRLGYTSGQFPVAEAAARETLALPVFPELTQAELQYVVDAIVAACRSLPRGPGR